MLHVTCIQMHMWTENKVSNLVVPWWWKCQFVALKTFFWSLTSKQHRSKFSTRVPHSQKSLLPKPNRSAILNSVNIFLPFTGVALH